MAGDDKTGSAGPSSPKAATSPVGQKGSGPTSPISKKGSEPSSPTSKKGSGPSSPTGASPGPSAIAGILPAQHWVQAAEEEGFEVDDAASIADSIAASTDSLNSSILKYRKIHGRTYHSDVGNAAYWGANDDQQNESMDINHHVLTLLLDGKLFLAPLDVDKIQKVLDIGTGTGTWAIDFADEFPNIEVVGTDISPIQPGWIPPNLKFEIEDCTLSWTYPAESFDYVHLRLLVGSISDWEALLTEAYRALKPGGWVESFEGAAYFESDDGTLTEAHALGQWGKLFANFGETIGRPFTLVADDIQKRSMQAAGFVDIHEAEYKIPVGTWPKDPRLKEIGGYTQLAFEADIEGYVLYPATALGWKREEVTVYAAHVRKEMRSPSIHGYYRQKAVYGRKPV